jgi:hypothetical protein
LVLGSQGAWLHLIILFAVLALYRVEGEPHFYVMDELAQARIDACHYSIHGCAANLPAVFRRANLFARNGTANA